MKSFLVFVSIFIVSVVSKAFTRASEITIPDGTIQGLTSETIEGHVPYYSYRGIPYAKPPVDDLRFADPVPNDPWSDVLDGTKDGSNCTQLYPSLVSQGSKFEVQGSEDCLFINVYTTNLTGNRPVMVWIHGGGFIAGSSMYEEAKPDHILEQDVVFVSFNYRLGIFGFFSTGNEDAPGNWGLKDQILALKWVQNNIAYFGGDPTQVTIFGESAGGASVSYLVQAENAKGLFRGAIMDSGNSLCLWALTRNAKVSAFELGITLGIITIDSNDLVKNLRTVTGADLKKAENNLTVSLLLTNGALAGLPFGVVTEEESDTATVVGKSHESLSNGKFNQVPILLGYNSNEAGLLDDYVNIAIQVLYTYDLDVRRLAPESLTSNLFDRMNAGQEVRDFFCENSSLASHPQAVGKIVTIDQFKRGIREAANRYSKFVPTYMYQFSYEGNSGNPNRDYQGVGHAEELNYIFVTNNFEDPFDTEVRKKTVLMWTNFVKYLNPTPEESLQFLDNTIWPVNAPNLNTNTTLNYFNIDKNLTANVNPDQSYWLFYEKIFNQYGQPPFDTY